ncbi:hypothetical protein KBZ18_09875 [Synechococcus sp. Cruz-9H2]|uniref:hypothetical protein n=1 Tax=unclassified Synechococcus TaxID=2626047 RepID=UPI0020CD8085|nr:MULTISPECIES: hypothetical protein [unclassified Synechococcus]MCP9819801.1 hypothetical protein [Synechococcus sp. Cruz-9H2]MCP9844133.1 hypothetical protein [Synechococcus sp. Edmonson 11F2]MCP9856231.1 hypothetical protein [Synechococcus sp. Cruz-9C9]MCP9863516.1 hypothetical protein [Synechococcus sp. Cruz-7E5]MCP9870712.1 hypothetical protein [Synechococcus sp. Cruz-7B9]
MTDKVSKVKILLARLVLVLSVALVIIGVAMHSLSVSVFERIWQNLLDRPSGPMAFRFVLQPIMVAMMALVDGVKDARSGRNPYLWTILSNPGKRSSRLHEGLISTARVIILGLGMDLIYQWLVFDTFHPAEAVIIAGLLAFVPYLLLRGPITRVARWWINRGSAKETR